MNLVQLNTSDGSIIKSIQANEINFNYRNGGATISDDDSTLYVSAEDRSDNGYLCIYNVR